jgi:hypothetical protein
VERLEFESPSFSSLSILGQIDWHALNLNHQAKLMCLRLRRFRTSASAHPLRTTEIVKQEANFCTNTYDQDLPLIVTELWKVSEGF